MKICFFAQTKRFSGCEAIDIPLTTSIRADELWRKLDEQFPGIETIRATTRLARNCEFVQTDCAFEDQDEVALIPPVAGG